MSIVPRSERLTPSEASQLVGVHLATIWRWILRGVRGRKLAAMSYGGRRFILRRDLEEFLKPATPAVAPSATMPAKYDEDYLRRAREAGRMLDATFAKSRATKRRGK